MNSDEIILCFENVLDDILPQLSNCGGDALAKRNQFEDLKKITKLMKEKGISNFGGEEYKNICYIGGKYLGKGEVLSQCQSAKLISPDVIKRFSQAHECLMERVRNQINIF